MKRILPPLSVLAFAVLLLSGVPALAQEAQDAESAAAPAQPQQPAIGGKRYQQRMQQPPGPRDQPVDVPSTEKSGDDLIVHSSGGQYTVAGFFKDMDPGTMRPVNVLLPDRGNCMMQVDSNANVIDMTCQ